MVLDTEGEREEERVSGWVGWADLPAMKKGAIGRTEGRGELVVSLVVLRMGAGFGLKGMLIDWTYQLAWDISCLVVT